jgi:hypothetical protein
VHLCASGEVAFRPNQKESQPLFSSFSIFFRFSRFFPIFKGLQL